MTFVLSPFGPVEADLDILRHNLTSLVAAQHPILGLAAEHLFSARGKGIRPAIVLLVSRATMPENELTIRHRRLAEITEMIHTASLVHDDVIDHAQVRRGVSTVNFDFGNRVAVLAGDFLFAQSSWYLANLDNLEVVKLLSEVIKDFAEGEISQSLMQFDPELTLDSYLRKNHLKTASLIANSAKAAALLSKPDRTTADAMYEYGRCLGIAFQIIDDVLDFTSSTETLGKPAGSDLSQGNLTLPVLYAMEDYPPLRSLIENRSEDGAWLEQAVQWVLDSQGIARSQQLAKDYSRQAAAALQALDPSPSRQSLQYLTDYVLGRVS